MSSFSKKSLAAAVLASIIAFAAQAGAADTKALKNAQPDPSKEVIVRVNGKPITREELETGVANLFPLMSFHSSVPPDRLKQIQKTALTEIINEEVILKAARDAKMTDVDNKEIDAAINNLKKKLRKGQTLEDVLKNSRMSRAALREHFREQFIAKHFAQRKNEEFRKKAEETVNEAYMRDYYQKNLDKFREPEKIRLRSILIKADPSGGTKVWNESLKKAQDIEKKAKAGEDFARLAEKYSEDPYAKKGGDMGWAHRGSLMEEVEAAAENMKAGDITDPIMTIYGYHIFKLEGKTPPVQKKFEDLNRDNLKIELTAKEHKRLWEGWINGLKSASRIEYSAKDVKEIMAADKK